MHGLSGSSFVQTLVSVLRVLKVTHLSCNSRFDFWEDKLGSSSVIQSPSQPLHSPRQGHLGYAVPSRKDHLLRPRQESESARWVVQSRAVKV
jgi:hypothetical protein